MSRVKKGDMPQPTHATCIVDGWDYEANRPMAVEASDIEDADICVAAERFIRDYEEWRRIEASPAEAEARRAYGEHVARYLAGVFPGTRINADAYAAAAGEDLAHRSADIVKAVAQQARRTSKTLPPIATLVEMADAEADKRDAQARVYRRGLEAHASAVLLGKQMARDMAAEIAAQAPDIDARAIAELWRPLTDRTLGMPNSRYGRANDGADLIRDLRLVLEAIKRGNQQSADVLRSILADFRSYTEAEKAAEAEGDEDGAWGAWYRCQDAHKGWWALLAAAATEGAQPPSQATSAVARSVNPVPLVVAAGRRVQHAKFGLGSVVAEDDDRLDIEFDANGLKRVLARFVTPVVEVGR